MYTIVYTSIEMLDKKEWRVFFAEENFDKSKIILMAFDEVHTLIDWSDFRPTYTQIPSIIAKINPDIPMNLLTATCTPALKEAILTLIGIPKQDLHQVAVIPNRL